MSPTTSYSNSINGWNNTRKVMWIWYLLSNIHRPIVSNINVFILLVGCTCRNKNTNLPIGYHIWMVSIANWHRLSSSKELIPLRLFIILRLALHLFSEPSMHTLFFLTTVSLVVWSHIPIFSFHLYHRFFSFQPLILKSLDYYLLLLLYRRQENQKSGVDS